MNLYWTAELYAKQGLGIREDDIVFSAAKLFFADGLGNTLTFPLSVGATAILMAERSTPAAVFARLAQHKPAIFCGVPMLYAGMLASPAMPARADLRLADVHVSGRSVAARDRRAFCGPCGLRDSGKPRLVKSRGLNYANRHSMPERPPPLSGCESWND